MTAAGRGGARPGDEARAGAGPRNDDQPPSDGARYLAARWHRWRSLSPAEVPADADLFAQLPAALLMDRTLSARAVRLWGVLYLRLYDPRRRVAEGAVDPQQCCADARISPAMGRRYVAQLERAGWIVTRRTIRANGPDRHRVWLRLNLGRPVVQRR